MDIETDLKGGKIMHLNAREAFVQKNLLNQKLSCTQKRLYVKGMVKCLVYEQDLSINVAYFFTIV